MSVWGITRNGLVALSLAVATLWGCIAAERSLTRQAMYDRIVSLRTLDHLREQRSVPARDPEPISVPHRIDAA